MPVCDFCGQEMQSADSCTVIALHQHGRHVPLERFGEERGRRSRSARCGDCGVARGGFHHPGCDMQPCPVCGDQLFACGCPFDEDGFEGDDVLDEDDDPLDDEPFGVDGNGNPTERRLIAGQEVILHYDDIPESDVTEVRGIRCTTPVRTFIDVAPDMTDDDLAFSVRDALSRRLFTVAEAWQRLRQPDMATRPGAVIMRRVLRLLEPNHPDAAL